MDSNLTSLIKEVDVRTDLKTEKKSLENLMGQLLAELTETYH